MAEAAGPSTNHTAMATSASYPDPSKRLAMAEEYKNIGNDCYKSKNYRGAIGKYHRSLLQLKDLDQAAKREDVRSAFGLGPDISGRNAPVASLPQELLDKAADLEITCMNNLAACLLQQAEPNYSKVLHYCSQVLERSSGNGKALYRRGVALYHLHDYEAAQASLTKAMELTPRDANVKRYLELCSAAVSKQTFDEKERYKGMFDKMAAEGDH